MNGGKIASLFAALESECSSRGIGLSAGNCGQVAYAVCRWLRVRAGVKCGIVVVTNASTERELAEGEPDVYHMAVSFRGKFYDETGELDGEALADMAEVQYGNPDPIAFLFRLPEETSTVLKIISTQTRHSRDWNWFYDRLETLGFPFSPP